MGRGDAWVSPLPPDYRFDLINQLRRERETARVPESVHLFLYLAILSASGTTTKLGRRHVFQGGRCGGWAGKALGTHRASRKILEHQENRFSAAGQFEVP